MVRDQWIVPAALATKSSALTATKAPRRATVGPVSLTTSAESWVGLTADVLERGVCPGARGGAFGREQQRLQRAEPRVPELAVVLEPPSRFPERLGPETEPDPSLSERERVSVFYQDPAGRVFHTYSAHARGIDLLNAAYNYLDLVPRGRDEGGQGLYWVRRHDEYDR